MSKNAKLAYLLSVCRKASRIFFTKMIKLHSVGQRHGFSVRFNLEYGDTFTVNTIDYNFFKNGKIENILVKHIQTSLNPIETKVIRQGSTSERESIAIGEIASLTKKYKRLFVPVIVDYGKKNLNIVHQAAIIIDRTKNTILFYEPYGIYEKFHMKYDKCILDKLTYLRILLRLMYNDRFILDTYHHYYNLPTGIQKIIMVNNNAQADNFDKKYKLIINKLKTINIHIKAQPDQDDKTQKILYLMSTMGHIYETEQTPKIENQKIENLMIEVLRLYCCYNSKTCVLITLVEMDKYFYMDNPHDELPMLYNKFNVKTPNNILMRMLEDFIERINISNINTLIQSNMFMREACHQI